MAEPEAETYGTAGEVASSREVEEAFASAKEASRDAKEALRDAKNRAAEAYDRTATELNRAYVGARDYARENPGVAAAVTFAAGVGMGVLLSGRSYRRGIVPVAAVALAHAVLDVVGKGR